MGLVLKGRRRWGKAILFLGVPSTLLQTVLIYSFETPGPERWSFPKRNWQPATAVLLNLGKPTKTKAKTEPTTT